MDRIIKLQKTLFEIKRTILSNEKISKLLAFMNNDPLSVSQKPDINSLVTLTPVIEYENGIKDSFKNSFIAIYMSTSGIEDDREEFNIEIAVGVQEDYYELDKEKIRVLEIASELIRILDGLKTSSDTKLTYMGSRNFIIEKGNFAGYFLTWGVSNGNKSIF